MKNNPEVCAHRIDEILDDERRILLTGDFEALEPLRARKAELLARLSESREGLDAEDYQRLTQKATRNQELLNSAARGIAHVRQRMQEIRDAHSGAPSYTAHGQRTGQSAEPSITRQV